MSTVRITVAFASPEGHFVEAFEVPDGVRIRDLPVLTAVRERFPMLLIGPQSVGIFGKIVSPDTRVRAGDRIELYRPLNRDLKETRRLRSSARVEHRRKAAAP